MAAAPVAVAEAIEASAKPGAKPAPAVPERREKPRVNARDGTRVLVIDDSPTIVALLKRMLEQSGYTALEASDAESGVALALSEEPDLIFLDIVLPGMNGFEALRRLRRDPISKTTPIIMISGNELATEQFYAQRIGADDFMKKPFSRSEVFARIEKLLDAEKVLRRHVPAQSAGAAAIAVAATATAVAPVVVPAAIHVAPVAATLVPPAAAAAAAPIAAPIAAPVAMPAAATAAAPNIAPVAPPATSIPVPIASAAAEATPRPAPLAAVPNVEVPALPPVPAITIVMPGAAPATTTPAVIAAPPVAPSPAAVVAPPAQAAMASAAPAVTPRVSVVVPPAAAPTQQPTTH